MKTSFSSEPVIAYAAPGLRPLVFPARAPLFFALALAGTLAWMILSMLFFDIGRASELRASDVLWVWIGLALFQLVLTPEKESRVPPLLVAGLIAVGMVLSLVHLSLVEEPSLARFAPRAEACLITLAVAISSLRGLNHLSGRPVRAADFAMFLAMQWLLVFAAADLVLSWQNPNGIPLASRVRLVEMSLFGVGVHVCFALVLAHVPALLAAPLRDRAALVAMIAYNLGVVLLLFSFPILAAIPMFCGAIFFLVALTMLLRGRERLAPLVLFGVCVMIGAGATMRPLDSFGELGNWRHPVSAGTLGVAVVLGAALSARVGVPEKVSSPTLIRTAIIFYVVGILAHMGVEIYELDNHTSAHNAILIGSVLETAGVLLVAVAGLRSQMIRKRLRG